MDAFRVSSYTTVWCEIDTLIDDHQFCGSCGSSGKYWKYCNSSWDDAGNTRNIFFFVFIYHNAFLHDSFSLLSPFLLLLSSPLRTLDRSLFCVAILLFSLSLSLSLLFFFSLLFEFLTVAFQILYTHSIPTAALLAFPTMAFSLFGSGGSASFAKYFNIR